MSRNRFDWPGPLAIAALVKHSEGDLANVTEAGVSGNEQWCVLLACCDEHCRGYDDDKGAPHWALLTAGTEYAEKKGWASSPQKAWGLAQPVIRRLRSWGWMVLDAEGNPLVQQASLTEKGQPIFLPGTLTC